MDDPSCHLEPLPDNVFRANVGMVVVNSHGDVLALERSDVRGAWQLPQGGIDEGENNLEAAYRELHEETGIDRSKVKLLAEHPEWLAYELPKDKRNGKLGRGQVQKWFVFRFTGEDQDIDLKRAEDNEFSSWAWTRMDRLIQGAVPFRRSIYLKIAQDFSQYLDREA